MADRKKKQLKALGGNHVWVWVIVLCVIFVISSVVMGIMLGTYLSTLIYSKFNAEYSRTNEIAMIYQNAKNSDTELADIFAGVGRDIVITDSENNVIYESGTNTCSFEGGAVDDISIVFFVSEFDENSFGSFTVYRDSKQKAVYVNDSGKLTIDFADFFSNFNTYSIDLDSIDELPLDEGGTGETERDLLVGTGFIRLPYWISIDVDGGSQHFISKAQLSANLNDLALMLVAFLGLSLMILVLFIVLIVNIVNSVLRHNKLLKVFFTDVITNGHNLMHFLIKGGEYLRRYSSHSGRYAVIDLQFVNYRTFCVCHSIEEGEKVLCKVYEVIGANIDKKKEMCSHCGSADFAILMRFTDEEALRRRVQTLISQLSGIDSDHIFAFHAGIAVVEPDGTVGKDGQPIRRKDLDMELVFNNASTARATLEGSDDSGIAYFDEKLVEDQKWVDAVQEHQRSALENEEFLVYYQPKYDPGTDELRGAEALIRWQSPEFGFVPPGRIIPIFEKNGFITEIDHYMISHAARDQKMWLDKGCKCVPVSVNVSRAHFIESDLAEQIRDMVDAAGCPHSLIEIELTESAFFDDKKAMINTIQKLKSYGFAVSMDDFGSGYSSLNSLKDMPLDVLKLDAEFFRGENGGGRGEIVVTEAIRLAKSLNMRTVAEGVEVREQVDFLASQGCDMIQGYYYAKPMPKDEYELRMKNVAQN